MSQQMEGLQNLFVQSDVSRALIDDRIGELSKSIDRMIQRMENDGGTGPALDKIASTQERLVTVLEKNANSEAQGNVGDDAESRMRLRSIDVQLLRILEELSAGRQESTTALRGEISALTRALRDIAAQDQ
jgi:hypothetical protein